jgi:hypothetical protein
MLFYLILFYVWQKLHINNTDRKGIQLIKILDRKNGGYEKFCNLRYNYI